MKIAMDLSKVINFTGFYFFLVLLFTYAYCSHAEKISRESSKSLIVQEIMKKVGALSRTPHENQEIILKKIEAKLKKSAKAIGPDADKYIRFIMKEFKAKMNDLSTAKEKENNAEIKQENHQEHKQQKTNKQDDNQEKKQENELRVSEIKKKSFVRRTKPLENKKLAADIDLETEKDIIKDIALKIQTLAREFLKNAKTAEMKLQIMDKIKTRVLDSAKQRHVELHNKHSELKAYSSLIAQALDISIRQMIKGQLTGRRSAGNQAQRISEETTTGDKPKNFKKVEENILKKTMVGMDLDEINKYKNLISKSVNGTVDPRCDAIVVETCRNIKSISQIQCGEGKTIPIENLCNNVVDCVNGVDEENCAAQAMEQVRKATMVISEIEESINRNCIALSEHRLLKSRNQILQDVLHTQINFLEKHVTTSPINRTESAKIEAHDQKFVKSTVNDVNKIIKTLSYALDGALCAHTTNPNEFRKSSDNGVEKITEEKVDWSPKSCLCEGQYCQESTCEAACKLVCSQRYSLNRWECKSLNGTTSVSLDDLCDGKLDCFDETDESSCASDGTVTTSKFEAAKLYSSLLDLLSTKSKSYEFKKSRSKLNAMQRIIRQLQQQTTRTNTENHEIKALREDFFTQLVSIFDDLLETASVGELNDRYIVLQVINEKMVDALKASHTGNEILISPEGCYCRGGLCALRRCNKNCIQACLAEPILTKFACNDNISNMTLSTDLICNGVVNCPNAEDENECSNDICRGHHVVMLRHNLEKVGTKHKGTVMGEMIDSWKAKVSAALVVAETAERPTHRTLIEIVNRVLHDLVMAFASMEDYRRSNSEYALQEFKDISKIVMQALKSCAN